MHISLDAALQRQPLLSTVGDKLLPSFPGAAAAYSLRSLNGDANNVVEVRRDGDADGSTNEKTFTAEGVSLELEDWVNGKQETTLPADVATSAAAYSLRKVRSAYAGDVVRIRRSSDDVEVNVAFDANGEVSDSSAITNATESPDQGDTTATTLGGFLTEEVNLVDADTRNGDFDTDTLWTTQTGVTISGGSANWDGTQTGNTRCFQSIGSITAGCLYRVTYTCTVASGSFFANVGGNSAGATITSSGTYTENIVGGTSDTNFLFVGNASFVGTVDDVTLTMLTTDATVQTWYDQSGNGYDATQDTAGSQPKIAEAGSLLTSGIKFDGTDDYFDTTHVIGATSTTFAVSESNNSSDSLLDMRDTSGDGLFMFSAATDTFTLQYNASSLTGSSGASGEKLASFLAKDGSQKIHINGTEVGTASIAGAISVTATTKIGARSFSDPISSVWDGTMQEIVIYHSDQSDNRFKIESNINNHYGLYTSAYNGFVRTWYDQSGNGNDATQSAQDDQPKIVNAGSLLADGIDFDGSDDKLNFTALSASDVSIFSVVTFDSVAGEERIIGPQSGSNEGFGIGNATTGFFVASGVANSPALNATVSADATTLYSLIRASNTGTFFTNSTASSTFSNSSTFAGASLGGATNPVDGSLKELIIYDSDQTANRTGIESNIADEYGITLP